MDVHPTPGLLGFYRGQSYFLQSGEIQVRANKLIAVPHEYAVAWVEFSL
ncbi:MAG: hypothetical protein HIU89_17095 [Proteobacteria bacterium]|nr:hypothetical protein [Pseudomonadota bacterium]